MQPPIQLREVAHSIGYPLPQGRSWMPLAAQNASGDVPAVGELVGEGEAGERAGNVAIGFHHERHSGAGERSSEPFHEIGLLDERGAHAWLLMRSIATLLPPLA